MGKGSLQIAQQLLTADLVSVFRNDGQVFPFRLVDLQILKSISHWTTRVLTVFKGEGEREMLLHVLFHFHQQVCYLNLKLSLL